MTFEEATIAIARRQYAFPDVRDVFLIRRDDVRGVSLLVVSKDAVAGGIMPLGFLPPPGIPFPYVIVEVTPHELDEIVTGDLVLPEGWEVGERL